MPRRPSPPNAVGQPTAEGATTPAALSSTVAVPMAHSARDSAIGAQQRSPTNVDRPTAGSLVSGPSFTAIPKANGVVHIAVQGCCHGDLNKIYDACLAHEAKEKIKIDFLICCGDFQCVRNHFDLNSMAVPDKYKSFGDFVQYYNGSRVAPFLTLFVGGNHEASNVLAEQYYGGYVAPNIFYLGHSSVVSVCGVTIAALSGIFKSKDYTMPYPTVPYTPQTLREAYHVRSFEVEKLELFAKAIDDARKGTVLAPGSSMGEKLPGVDIVVSHDWPVGITEHGDESALVKIKPYFAEDIKHKALGNPHTMALLNKLRPKYWLAAHLHCHFTASVVHVRMKGPSVCVVSPPTRFLALDKCVSAARKFLEFIDVTSASLAVDVSCASPRSPPKVLLHPLWVEIIRRTHSLLRVGEKGLSWHSIVPWENSVRGQFAEGSFAQVDLSGELEMQDTDTLIGTLRLAGGNPLLAKAAPPPSQGRPSTAPSTGAPILAQGSTTHHETSGGVMSTALNDALDWCEDLGQ